MSSDSGTLTEVAAPPPSPTREEAPAVLRVEGVRKSWRKPPRVVLAGIDLSVAPGTATWIGGDNGAGKTTLLRVVAGLIKADAGTIRLDGIDLERDRRRYHEKIGFLSAGNTGLYNRLSVRFHLDYWARLAFIPRRDRAAAVAGALEEFQLGELADRRVERMSMGQRQRVRLAMAFLHRPKLLLLDEARTSLDGLGKELLSAACREALEEGRAILACSPTGETEEDVAFDRKFVIRDGCLEPVQ